MRIRQAKNIRRRNHQKWFEMVVPRPLLPILASRWLTAQPTEPLVQVSYRQFLRFPKSYLQDPSATTYSIRRTVFEQLRRRVHSIDEMTKVTLHRDPDQLRWYLDAPPSGRVSSSVEGDFGYGGVYSCSRPQAHVSSSSHR
eukprot:PhM_4_TR11668/c1_g3_i6/m.63995